MLGFAQGIIPHVEWICTQSRAHYQRWERAASTLVCQRYYLFGVIPFSPGQVLILCSINLWAISNELLQLKILC